MHVKTAERLAAQALRISDELTELVREIEASEPDEESVRLRLAISRVMWAVYYDILAPTLQEHPSAVPEPRVEAPPAPKPWGTSRPARLREQRAHRSAPGYRRRRQSSGSRG